jgi:hypothetical protein
MKISHLFLFLFLLFTITENLNAQNTTGGFGSFGISATNCISTGSGILPNKDKIYSCEIEGIFNSIQVKNISFNIAAGMKDFNTWHNEIRFLSRYFTMGLGMVYKIPSNKKWHLEIPFDARLNIGNLHKTEYFQSPPSYPNYNYIYSKIQIKSGVAFLLPALSYLDLCIFVKGGYTFGNKEYNSYDNIYLGDINFHAYTGLMLVYKFKSNTENETN